MTHPIHAILGNIITIVLSLILAGFFVVIAYWVIVGFFRSLFGQQDEVPDVLTEEQKELYALPIGAPRDGGNNFYADGWRKMTQEQADAVREFMKLKAKEKTLRESDGWEILAPETAVHHPEHSLEVMNDGPDDVEEEEVERPDEIQVHG